MCRLIGSYWILINLFLASCAVGYAQTSALDALIDAARQKSMPIGIICDDNKTLLKTVSLARSETADPIESIVDQMKGYTIHQKGLVTIVAPEHPSKPTHDLLYMNIPRFSAPASTATGLSLKLWMEVEYQSTLPRPQTFAGVIHHTDERLLAPIDLRQFTVEAILSYIISSVQGGAAWVILPTPKALNDQPDDRLWGIIRYDSAPVTEPVEKLCCLSRTYLNAVP